MVAHSPPLYHAGIRGRANQGNPVPGLYRTLNEVEERMRKRLGSIAMCAGLVLAGLTGVVATRTQGQPAPGAPAPAAPADTAALRAQYERWRTEFKTWGKWAPVGQESKGTTNLITPQKVASAL